MSKLDSKSGALLDVAYNAAVDSGDFVALGPILAQAETDGDATAAGYTARRGGIYYGATKASGTAFGAWDLLQWDATNERWTKDAALPTMGIAVAAALSGATTCDVLVLETALDGVRVYEGGTATAVTGASEAVTQAATIPAGDLAAGDILLTDGNVFATSTTSTETSRVRLRFGGLTGTVIADTTAVDVANSDKAFARGQVNIVTVGAAAASEINCHGTAWWSTNGTVKGAGDNAVTSHDLTAAVTVVATVENSSTGESIIGKKLKVIRIRPSAC